MLKKFTLSILAVIIIVSLLSITATAAPYKELKIGDGVSRIDATYFDTEYDHNGADGGRDIRPEETIGTEFGDNSDHGFDGNVGWTDQSEWIQYTIKVEFDGKYKLDVWAASDNGSNNGFIVFFDGNKIGESGHITQEGWQAYTLYPVASEFNLTAGTHIMKVEMNGGGHNIAGYIFTLLERTAAAAPVAVEAPAAPAPVVEAAPAPAPAVSEVVLIPKTSDAVMFPVILLALAAVAFVSFRKVRVSK